MYFVLHNLIGSNMSLNLQDIASKLESLEETIIFRILDRAQLGRNRAVYQDGVFPLNSGENNLLSHMMRFHEETHSMLGRYSVAEERPFFANLPEPSEKIVIAKNSELHIDSYNLINLNDKIKDSYFKLLDDISAGDDGEYGTTAETDITTLQAIARRIHYGSFYVAESKYQANPDQYRELIEKRDTDSLMKLLTRQEVEDRIIERITIKCESIQSVSNPNIRKKIDSRIVSQFYFDTIIPLTKDGEILYLLNRKL